MKLIYLILILIFSLIMPVKIQAIVNPLETANNQIGIHIFDPNEIESAAKLVNSNGGEWGYITVPLRSDDRDREKWQKFMADCTKLKLIPIIRLSSTMTEKGWSLPTKWDSIDFANFLNDLDWPTQNRYVIIYNEPNHDSEWGGRIDPTHYAFVLDETIDIFKSRNPDFFILAAGLDMAAPNNAIHMAWRNYLNQMHLAKPEIFSKIDGWNSHAYPNYAFAGSPYDKHDHSIISYRWELEYIKKFTSKDLPVFITETGWSNKALTDETIARYWQIAFSYIWTDKNIVAITPFVLQAGAPPFDTFCFLDGNSDQKPSYQTLYDLPKVCGTPKIPEATKSSEANSDESSASSQSNFNLFNPDASKLLNEFTDKTKRLFLFLKKFNLGIFIKS